MIGICNGRGDSTDRYSFTGFTALLEQSLFNATTLNSWDILLLMSVGPGFLPLCCGCPGWNSIHSAVKDKLAVSSVRTEFHTSGITQNYSTLVTELL